jgi:hypothetical protein
MVSAMGFEPVTSCPKARDAVPTPFRGVALGLSFRNEERDYLFGVTFFRIAAPSSFACSSMAASCFFTYSD